MNFNIVISRKFYSLQQTEVSASINSKIKALVQHGKYSQALELYSKTHHSSLTTTKFTFPSLLKACASLSNLYIGRTIHASIVTMGLRSDPYIATSLINMYMKCGSLTSALQMFDKMSESGDSVPDITVWNSVIDGYFKYGRFEEGLGQFCRMQELGIRADGYSLSIVLVICDKLSWYMAGRQIHGYIIRNMFEGDPYLETELIGMYSSCNRPEKAWSLFGKLENRSNIVAWNVMIRGFVENGMWEKSLELYSLAKNESCKLDSASFTGTFIACSHGEVPTFGRQVHCEVIKVNFQDDPYVSSALLTMYAKAGSVDDAVKVFDRVPGKEVEVWNAMISAYMSNGHAYDALRLYNKMKEGEIPVDSFTISSLLSGCCIVGSDDFGRTVHGEIIKRSMQNNVAIQSALLTMYCKCGNTIDADSVFHRMKERDVVAWGAMISGFCQNGRFKDALNLFRAMEAEGLKADSDVMASVISAGLGMENTELCCLIHGFAIKRGLELDVFVASSLVDMYSKLGFAENAEIVFSRMPNKNLVAWNSMIACYSRNALPEMSISLLPQILKHGFYPDSVSITTVLVAVSSVAALLKGKAVHAYQIRLQIPLDLQVENALIDMYVKGGCLKYAQLIFENMPRRNLVTWNSIIAGYGSNGDCKEAVRLFKEMKRFETVPDEVTFLALITSCSHSGMVEEGLNLFRTMKIEYGLEPRMEHYTSVVDLLGRAGCLDDAYRFIQEDMPIEADRSVWLCLLFACRAHQNMELAELAADNLLKMEPGRGSNYVPLLSLYGEVEMWDRAANLRASMKERGLKKSPGCSWIEVKNRVDVFFSGDSSSPRRSDIYETLSTLKSNMEGKECSYEEIEEC